ncbi:MAG: hypothetical protein R2712_19355 [Vicinamibacterales bacterium]
MHGQTIHDSVAARGRPTDLEDVEEVIPLRADERLILGSGGTRVHEHASLPGSRDRRSGG